MALMIPRREHDRRRAHEELSRLAQLRARLDFDEGRWMLRAERARVHAELSYATFAEYIERLFGYDAQSTREKLRVAAALKKLPGLCRALSDAELSWSAVRELSRVATSETETEWLEATRGQTVRQIERQVAGRKPGDRPADRPDPTAERHVLRFEVSGSTLATFREAISKLRHEADSALDDDAALLLMARHVLRGPTDEGRASYQILVDVCDQCGHGQQQACGEAVTLEPEAVAMATCDAQRLATSHVGHKNETNADKKTGSATNTKSRPRIRGYRERPNSGPIDWEAFHTHVVHLLSQESSPIYRYFEALALAHLNRWQEADVGFTRLRQLRMPGAVVWARRDPLLDSRGAQREVQCTVRKENQKVFLKADELGTDLRGDRDHSWPPDGEIIMVCVLFTFGGTWAIPSVAAR